MTHLFSEEKYQIPEEAIGEIPEVIQPLKEKQGRFNSFLLANAFGVHDKLNLWVYYRQAIAGGVALEELVGVLFWKIKDMILKKNFSKYSLTELQNSAARLAYLLPEARQRGHDTEEAFEQFLLEVL